MEFHKEQGLVGRVEIPKDGWFHDWVMAKVLKGTNSAEMNKYPLLHDVPHYGQRKEDKSWTTKDFKKNKGV